VIARGYDRERSHSAPLLAYAVTATVAAFAIFVLLAVLWSLYDAADDQGRSGFATRDNTRVTSPALWTAPTGSANGSSIWPPASGACDVPRLGAKSPC
jgi:hypothetical protein